MIASVRPGVSAVSTISYKLIWTEFHQSLSDDVHCVSEKNDTKNDTDVTHYRFNPHQPISVIFGRDVAEGVCY